MQMMRIAAVIALDVERQGGLLLHGALVERDGHGVILAGPSGAGKTTATQRLSRPWRPLSDDATLVIRDKQGEYYAHPWPTWSRFLSGKPGGVWNVQDGVPLKGIFLLSQAQDDQIIPVNCAQAVCLLVESVEQASCMLSRGMNKDEERNLHLNRFDNICALAQVVPYHFLHLSLTGCFWREIERVIIGSGKGAS
jgi:SynChlorMet cassette protein ScmC